MVEGTGLENRRTGNGIVSSNLTLSAAAGAARVTRQRAGSGSERAVVEPRAGAFVYQEAVVVVVSGWMAEWFKAHAWKACVRQKRTVSSNLTPSVIRTPRASTHGAFCVPAARLLHEDRSDGLRGDGACRTIAACPPLLRAARACCFPRSSPPRSSARRGPLLPLMVNRRSDAPPTASHTSQPAISGASGSASAMRKPKIMACASYSA